MTRKTTPDPVRSPDGLKLVITIVNREKTEYYIDLIQSCGANMQLTAPAHGTAKTEVLDVLGLNDDGKTVIFSVISADRAPALIETLGKRFGSIKNGKGIAFSVPFTGMIGVLAYRFLADKREDKRFL